MPLNASEILHISKIIPVVSLNRPQDAVPLANALLEGGIHIIEVTLRTECALEAIETIRTKVPGMRVGAGTVTKPDDLQQCSDAGAEFFISPGLSAKVLAAAPLYGQPLIPGVATPSEIMQGLEHNIDCFKFFPASINGGVPALKALQGPFANLTFCPTGGVDGSNYQDYLKLNNVACVGGSWVCKQQDIREGRWDLISEQIRHYLDKLTTES